MILAYLALCAIAWAVSRNRLALAIAGGVVLTQAASFLPDEVVFPAYAAIWVSIGSAAIYRAMPMAGVLLIASGLCYFWADVIGAAPALWVPPMVAADLFGLAALCVAGWPGDRVGKGNHLGGYFSGRGARVADGGVVVSAEAAAKEIGGV